MENQIYIPKKLKVGYQKRLDTYSKKLAYVTYFDDKGKLRKETSWTGWIDKKQGIDEFDNEPMEGFVLNRNVGGAKQSYGWDVRIEKVRVYDPRGFEFEIDLPNVLFILNECTSTKGKGLEGTFVYGWNGPSLVLIPTTCEEYRKSQDYTKLQTAKVSSKELIEGATYQTKKQETRIYLGKFDWFEDNYRKGGWKSEKKYVFVDPNGHLEDDYIGDLEDYDSEEEYQKELDNQAKEHAKAIAKGENFKFIPMSSVANLATCVSDTPISNYAELLAKFNKTVNAGIPVELIEKPATPKPELKKDRWREWQNKDTEEYFLKQGDVYVSVNIHPEDSYNEKKEPKKWELNSNHDVSLIKGTFKAEYSYHEFNKSYTTDELKKLSFVKLYVKLNNNSLVDAKKYF